MSRHDSDSPLAFIGGIVLVILAMGLITGPDDYAEAKAQERVICSREAAPEFCRHVE
jgi:hypothetical protein